MKKKQWAQSFSLIDEKYVEEADPMRDAGCVSAVRRLRRRIITLAACAAAVLLGLILLSRTGRRFRTCPGTRTASTMPSFSG